MWLTFADKHDDIIAGYLQYTNLKSINQSTLEVMKHVSFIIVTLDAKKHVSIIIVTRRYGIMLVLLYVNFIIVTLDVIEAC